MASWVVDDEVVHSNKHRGSHDDHLYPGVTRGWARIWVDGEESTEEGAKAGVRLDWRQETSLQVRVVGGRVDQPVAGKDWRRRQRKAGHGIRFCFF